MARGYWEGVYGGSGIALRLILTQSHLYLAAIPLACPCRCPSNLASDFVSVARLFAILSVGCSFPSFPEFSLRFSCFLSHILSIYLVACWLFMRLVVPILEKEKNHMLLQRVCMRFPIFKVPANILISSREDNKKTGYKKKRTTNKKLNALFHLPIDRLAFRRSPQR